MFQSSMLINAAQSCIFMTTDQTLGIWEAGILNYHKDVFDLVCIWPLTYDLDLIC